LRPALINALNRDEVLDLIAYFLSRKKPGDAMFRWGAASSTRWDGRV